MGSIARGVPNNGIYAFDPRTVSRDDMAHNSWKWFHGGMVKVVVRDMDWITDMGDGQYWSEQIPFSWYFKVGRLKYAIVFVSKVVLPKPIKEYRFVEYSAKEECIIDLAKKAMK